MTYCVIESMPSLLRVQDFEVGIYLVTFQSRLKKDKKHTNPDSFILFYFRPLKSFESRV